MRLAKRGLNRTDPKIVTSREAIQFWCPLCHAEAGDPCRRVGDQVTMKVPHRERRRVARAARTLTGQQRLQLAHWLAANGRIFWEDG